MPKQKGFAHFLLIGFLFLSVILGVFLVSQRTSLLPKASTDGIDLSFFPSETQVREGDNFNLDIGMDAKDKTPAAAEVIIEFDPDFLEATSVSPGAFMPVEIQAGQISANRVSITLGSDPDNPKSGFGVLATVGFRPKKPGTTTVSFNSSTKVSLIGQTDTSNKVGDLNTSTVIISAASLGSSAQFSLSPSYLNVQTNEEKAIQVLVQSDTDTANLFTAKLTFDPAVFQITRLDTNQTFIQNWAEQTFDNPTGKINLVGAVPSPGFKTNGGGAVMATIYVQGVSAHGTANLSFDGSSAIFRNSDNQNILQNSTGSQINSLRPQSSRTATASTAPATQNSNTASASPSPDDGTNSPQDPDQTAGGGNGDGADGSYGGDNGDGSTQNPDPDNNAGAGSGADGSYNSSPSPGDSISDNPQEPLGDGGGVCTLTSAEWQGENSTVRNGNLLRLVVTGQGDCTGKDVLFEVKQDQPFLAGARINTPPSSAKFSNDKAVATWVAEYSPNGPFGVFDPPKYIFTAKLAGSDTLITSQDKIAVSKLGASQFRKGDGNKDSRVNLQDLSVLFSKWFSSRSQGTFVEELDLNDDGVVNSVDFASITEVLRTIGILRRSN